MARYFTQTLIKLPHSLSSPSKLSLSSSSRLFASKAQLIELDLDSSSSTDSTPGGGGDVEVMGLKRLEDAIHSIIVRRLAPDWLPFRPGSSYWVPPKRKADNILEVVGKLTNPLTPEEALSVSSARGWPSSSYFCQEGSVSGHPIPVEVEVQVHVQDSTEKSISEDED